MTNSTIKSTIFGKAYEYACILAISNLLHSVRPFKIIENKSLEIAELRFNEISETEREEMLKSATAGIKAIMDMEPCITEDGKDLLTISLQADDVAKTGDIRDVIIIRRSINWEIGISVKHNHAALKHSRLSPLIDFGKVWLNIPCSKTYFEDIKPIFDYLLELKDKKESWENIKNKDKIIYVPILKAFMKEFTNLYEKNKNDVVSKIIKYFLGSNDNDYYKLIHFNKHVTRVQPFNINGQLNKSSNINKPKTIFCKIPLPTKILDLSFKANSLTTIHLTMDNGWAISFRIHNASTKVETSLKFDIQLLGQPANLFYIDAEW